MSATVTMETWILNASAKLGAIELVDHLNKGTAYLSCVLEIFTVLKLKKFPSSYMCR